MLFLIFWETYPDKLQEVFKLAKEGKLSTPPGVKTIEEYGTPEGLYVEIVETESEEALYKYVITLLPYHRNVEVKLAFPAKKILALF